ncbi:sensor histidine kinase [Acetobacteroides hydrogenigenes]|uniref:histidine kinase n=1 Tax=Acetobacteroides hydrogenigenes TaxID=979970 RepID=A0A4V2RNJ0_9BACT|nr:HAMP domain-containing sensor histidine kinase [Acetobacteroides hydrogenigenes]TCN63880.1 signal transduction histidine kinase [Acetobacteroides hydrogenigenes]
MKLTDVELLDELKSRFEENAYSLKHLSELNLELMSLNRKLEESEKMKSNFLSNIRNEIVNPFASILGLATHIQACGPDRMDKVRQMAAMIHSEAFSLDFQLQNIFAAAELEAGESHLSCMNVDVSALLESVIESYRFELQKRSITVDLTCSCKGMEFKTDAGKLKLIILNLLDNGIKFSQMGGRVEIVSSCSQGILEVAIRDYGIGIEEKNLAFIFDRFKRINTDVNTLNGGYGLGLTVAKAMLEALEGTIEVHSKVGEGSQFIVRIPEAKAADEVEGFAADANEFMFDSDNEIF